MGIRSPDDSTVHAKLPHLWRTCAHDNAVSGKHSQSFRATGHSPVPIIQCLRRALAMRDVERLNVESLYSSQAIRSRRLLRLRARCCIFVSRTALCTTTIGACEGFTQFHNIWCKFQCFSLSLPLIVFRRDLNCFRSTNNRN